MNTQEKSNEIFKKVFSRRDFYGKIKTAYVDQYTNVKPTKGALL